MAIKIPILILAFVYFANFLLSLLQLEVVIIIQAFVYGFSSFWIVLDRFRSFQFVPHFSKYRSELLFLQVAFIARIKRYQFIYLPIFVLQFPLKFLINISCFDEEAVVKFHNRLKRTKTCRLWVFRKSQNFFKICREEPVLGSFYCKVADVMAYKRLLCQFYKKRDAYKETLTQLLSVDFEKNMNTTINTSARLSLKYC